MSDDGESWRFCEDLERSAPFSTADISHFSCLIKAHSFRKRTKVKALPNPREYLRTVYIAEEVSIGTGIKNRCLQRSALYT